MHTSSSRKNLEAGKAITTNQYVLIRNPDTGSGHEETNYYFTKLKKKTENYKYLHGFSQFVDKYSLLKLADYVKIIKNKKIKLE